MNTILLTLLVMTGYTLSCALGWMVGYGDGIASVEIPSPPQYRDVYHCDPGEEIWVIKPEPELNEMIGVPRCCSLKQERVDE